MALSISEILANQARKQAAASRVAPRNDTAKPAAKSAAQIMAEQQAKIAGAPAPKFTPPPEPVRRHKTVAEIMAEQQAKVAARDAGRAEPSANINLDRLKAEYADFVKNLMAEMDGMGPMFFVPGGSPEKPEAAGKVNGVSTAEGEMVMDAQPSAQVGTMPYQATPTVSKPSRRRRSKATAEESPAETEG